MYAVAGSWWDASSIPTRVKSPRSCGVIFSQFAPPSFVMCTRPSSEPAHNTLASWCDSENEKMVAYVSAPEVSFVIGPPDASMVEGSARVRSGLTASQLLPTSLVLKTTLPVT